MPKPPRKDSASNITTNESSILKEGSMCVCRENDLPRNGPRSTERCATKVPVQIGPVVDVLAF